MLIDKGANVNAKGTSSSTALMQAARTGKIEILKILLANGAIIDNASLKEAAGNGHAEVVRLLVERITDIHANKAQLDFPLLLAAQNGHVEIVSFLIEKGGNVNTSDAKGNTPIILSSGHGKLPVVKLLVKNGADIKSRNNEGINAYTAALAKGYAEITDMLKVSEDETDINLELIDAANHANTKKVRTLLAKGANPNTELLSIDKQKKAFPLIIAIKNSSKEITQALLENGANPNISDFDAHTPLIYAAEQGNLEIVKLLLAKGADINGIAKGTPFDPSYYATPLLYATEKGHKEVVEFLLNNGADKGFMAYDDVEGATGNGINIRVKQGKRRDCKDAFSKRGRCK